MCGIDLGVIKLLTSTSLAEAENIDYYQICGAQIVVEFMKNTEDNTV